MASQKRLQRRQGLKEISVQLFYLILCVSHCSLKYHLKADLLRWMSQLQGKIYCDPQMESRDDKVLHISAVFQ